MRTGTLYLRNSPGLQTVMVRISNCAQTLKWIALSGSDHLEAMEWRNNKTSTVEKHKIGALFSMIGAVPNSAWVEGCVARDGAGFIKTGSDLSKEDLERAKWPLERAPYLPETSLPGVF